MHVLPPQADVGRASRDCLVTVGLVCRKRLIARCSSLPPPRRDQRSRLGRPSSATAASPRGNPRCYGAATWGEIPLPFPAGGISQLLRCRPGHRIPLPCCRSATARPDPAPSARQTCWGSVPALVRSPQDPLAFLPPPRTPRYKNSRPFLQPHSSGSRRQERGEGLLNSNVDVSGRVMLKVLNENSHLHVHFISYFEIQSL